MENVKFHGRSYSETLSTGRTVKVGLAEDGSHWGFVLGLPDDPEEQVRFALSAEAFEAVERLVAKLRKHTLRAAWALEWTPIDTDGGPS